MLELIFADLSPNRKLKFPQNFSNAKNKGSIIHRTALKCNLIKLAVETRMPVTFDSQIQWLIFFARFREYKALYLNVFWLKNSRFLTVKFAIQKMEFFFFLCHNLHFYTSGSSALGKESCQISRQTDNSFGRYGTRNTPW